MNKTRKTIYGTPIEVTIEVDPDRYRWVRGVGESMEDLADEISNRPEWEAEYRPDDGERAKLVIEHPRRKSKRAHYRKFREQFQKHRDGSESVRTELSPDMWSEAGDPFEDIRAFSEAGYPDGVYDK